MADVGNPARAPRGFRLAADPRPYWSATDGQARRSTTVVEKALTDLVGIGFTAVTGDRPDGMSAARYASWIGGFGLAAAPGEFSSPFDETIDITDEMERARLFAADQVSLDLDRAMVSSLAVPARMAAPARGADFDEDRLTLAIENCGIVCQVLQSEGLRPLHRSHVGGVFETEAEIVRLLDTLGPDLIGFGPDIGHLCWAGADPAALIRRYPDRLGAIYLKDCFPDYLGPATRDGMSYLDVLDTKRIWAPPGRGVVDWRAVLDALPAEFDGDCVIEVDPPTGDSPYGAFEASYTWASRSLARFRN